MTIPDRRVLRAAGQNQIERTFQGVISCRGYRKTWAFPREVSELLERETAGMSVLHLFGGRATFGLRLDADPSTKPDVIGNAFYPPFRCESFDAVICDPPYTRKPGQWWAHVIRPAICLARQRIWWFSPWTLGGHGEGQRLRRWWAVVPNDCSALRYLAELERLRHPPHCFNRKPLSGEIAKYDWRQRIEEPQLFGGAA